MKKNLISGVTVFFQIAYYVNKIKNVNINIIM